MGLLNVYEINFARSSTQVRVYKYLLTRAMEEIDNGQDRRILTLFRRAATVSKRLSQRRLREPITLIEYRMYSHRVSVHLAIALRVD